MSDEITIRMADAADLPGVLPMWKELYRIEAESGLAYPLRDDAADIWFEQASQRIESRNYFMLVAEDVKGSFAGFHTGQIRRRPAIYRDAVIGSLIEIYIDSSYRGKGIAKRFLEGAIEFFKERGIKQVEAPTLVGNEHPHKMYERYGWKTDLIQYRWDIE